MSIIGLVTSLIFYYTVNNHSLEPLFYEIFETPVNTKSRIDHFFLMYRFHGKTCVTTNQKNIAIFLEFTANLRYCRFKSLICVNLVEKFLQLFLFLNSATSAFLDTSEKSL
jgi:hypothetical protein